MRVHHLDCATMCPFGGRLLTGDGPVLAFATLVGHCLLLETRAGLVLVDTGLGTRDVADPTGRLGRGFLWGVRPVLDPAATALARVRALGLSPDEVRDVVLTHLDLDHAGGLADFPAARVHVHAPEHDAAMRRATWLERERYHPAQWDHRPLWVRHAGTAGDGERWLGFDAVRALPGTTDDVLLIPLPGHTRGHCAVAVNTSGGWLLHCGDAYFHRDEVRDESPTCPPALAAYQRLIAMDDTARRANQGRLRTLAREQSTAVRLMCAHDAVDFARCVAESHARG